MKADRMRKVKPNNHFSNQKVMTSADENNKSSSISDTKRGTDDTTEDDEIETLKVRIADNTPESGVQLKCSDSLTFESMPISRRTLQGLHSGKLTAPTEIQAAAIPHALAGRDILGAAKTGSGKTLSFVVPILERLFMERWGLDDGLAAIVVTPTRELALQIFEVIRTVGRKHQFSAGLVTGGKKEFQGEQERIVRMNILVATPGRLLQHFEQTPGFDASQLLVLVLDEADRILDMGFKMQLDNILQYLPSTSRQTLLFSATQTKSVKDLARLSLNDPEYVAVHTNEEFITPKQLVQNYVVCKLQDKLDVLFSFIKAHLKSKLMIFFSTCSQVRYVHELFRGMQPGIVLTSLHGKIKQERRTMIYMDFVKRKSVCMLATDIAARGLDFPDVDWVIQVDAPEDSAMYIHRVGRTARHISNGRALLMLMPGEEKVVTEELKKAGVPISKLTVNPNHKVSVANRASSMLVAQPEWKNLAKKAFTGYLRSIQLLPHRMLELHSLPTDDYAKSLGLPFTPPLPIVVSSGDEGRDAVRGAKNVNRSLDKLKKQIKEAKEARRREKEEALADAQGLKSKVTKSNLSVEKDVDSSDEGDDFLTVKQVHNLREEDDVDDDVIPQTKLSRKQLKKLKIPSAVSEDSAALMTKSMRLAGAKRTKFAYDDVGNIVEEGSSFDENPSSDSLDIDHMRSAVAKHVERVKSRVDRSREEDLSRDRERIRNLHKEQRIRNKGEKAQLADDGDGEGVQLIQDDENSSQSNIYTDHDTSDANGDSDSGEISSSEDGDVDEDEDEDEDVNILRSKKGLQTRLSSAGIRVVDTRPQKKARKFDRLLEQEALVLKMLSK